MRRTAAIYIIFFALLLILLLALITVDNAVAVDNAMAVQPSCVEYDRLEEQDNIDPIAIIDIAENIDLCRVDIKAATNVWEFTEDGCQDGYCVIGFSFQTIVVERTCKEAPGCHAISYIALYKIVWPTSVDDPYDFPWDFPRSYKVYLPAMKN